MPSSGVLVVVVKDSADHYNAVFPSVVASEYTAATVQIQVLFLRG
jgi:hypothetical protein